MNNIGKFLGAFAAIIFVPVFLLIGVIYLPIDYFKYKNSIYYKDTREKYSLFCAISYYVKLYDAIKNAELPIEYYRNEEIKITGFGYFVYQNILIINDMDAFFDVERNIWTVEVDDEYVDVEPEINSAIKDCNKLVGIEKCKRAVVLIDSDKIEKDVEIHFDNYDFIAVESDDYVKALKTIIE